MADAARDFPVPIAPGVLHCGYHSADSFGATAYFVPRPDGNLLVDVPRFAAPLVKRIEGLGGLRWILLTHRDDVADHAKWAERFGAARVLHRRDASFQVERVLDGDAPSGLAPGVTALPTPGHTAGHACYLVDGAERVLFTGDHLAWDDEAGRLEAWPDVCWHDWGEQTESMRRLAEVDADWVLPGHGRGHRVGRAAWKGEVERLVAWMEAQA